MKNRIKRLMIGAMLAIVLSITVGGNVASEEPLDGKILEMVAAEQNIVLSGLAIGALQPEVFSLTGVTLYQAKVIDTQTGRTPGFSKAFLRASLRIPSEVFFYLGFLMAFFMPLKQTFHDKLSNCVVVND